MYYSELANCSAAQLREQAVAEGKDEANMNNRKTGTGLLLTEALNREPSLSQLPALSFVRPAS